MKLKKNKFLILAVCLGLMALLLAGCGGEEATPTGEEAKGKITLGYVNWAEGIAMTHLAQAIIEDKLGYEVETQQADVAIVFQGVAAGDYDAFMDVWLPTTHHDYLYGENGVADEVDDYGLVYEGARIGLVVPEYVEIDSIEDMNEYKDEFGGKIIGIDSGAGIMKATAAAIEEYGLDYELVASSEAAMIAELSGAVDDNRWIAITGWTPHWKFAEWDLKFLDDPKKVYGETENISVIARKGLDQDAPEVANLLKNFYMTDQQLGELEAMINDGMEPVEAGRQWMQENEDVVNSWLQ